MRNSRCQPGSTVPTMRSSVRRLPDDVYEGVERLAGPARLEAHGDPLPLAADRVIEGPDGVGLGEERLQAVARAPDAERPGRPGGAGEHDRAAVDRLEAGAAEEGRDRAGGVREVDVPGVGLD